MVKYHPDFRFLTDYAAGTLPVSQALCVVAHLHYCTQCRQRVSELTSLGEALFITQEPLQTGDNTFDVLMARIDSHNVAATSDIAMTRPSPQPSPQELPLSISKLVNGNLENLKWSSLGKRFNYSRLSSRKDPRETALFHIKAGGRMPHHEHRGDEITVVLQGSFSDQEDHYHVGDFIVRSKGEKHRPVAAQHEDCLCLSTLDAPIRMSNWFLRMIMPVLTARLA